MSDVTISPNMSLLIPNVGVDPGPDWANNLNASLSIIDGHSHTPGSGVQITPSALDINSDLTMQKNNLTVVRTVRFDPQVSAIAALSPDIGCLYEAGVDLYYNDGSGNQIRITQGGAVAGASGTITGLPSGTASAAYVSGSGTFVFQQATSTAANFDIGTIVLRYPGSYPSPAGNFIMLEAPATLASGYAIKFPATTPGIANALYTMNTSGVLSYTNVDSSSLIISSSTLQINTQGVLQTMLALKPTGTSVAVGGFAISGDSGNFQTSSTTPVQVTNSVITLVTAGRPVRLEFYPLNTNATAPSRVFYNASVVGDDSYIGFEYSTDGGSTWSQAAVFIYTVSVAGGTSPLLIVPIGSFSCTVPLAANTYMFRATGYTATGTCQTNVVNVSLAAYEI